MNRSSYLLLGRAGGAVASLLVLLAPAPAFAHGIADSARDKSVAQFVPLGTEHMLLGFDHLLFIAGVVLLADSAVRAAKLISLFVLGHSLTLLVATLSGWQISATLVDVVIALSVVFVGVLGLRGGAPDWRLVSAAVFGFGLVHGLGLSTRLQHVGLPEDGLFWRVIAFNVGVEIGQLIAIAAIVAIGTLVTRRILRERLQHAGYLALVAAGSLAAGVLSFQAAKDAGTTAPNDTVRGASDSCRASEADPPAFAYGGGHPAKRFYVPGDEVPDEDLRHVIGDGWVIVRYHPELPAEQRDRLQRLSRSPGQAVSARPPATRQSPSAFTRLRER